MKFGGALLKDAQGTIAVGKLVEEFICEPLLIVVSAIGKTTNALEKLHQLKDNVKDRQDHFLEIKRYHIALYNDLFPNGNSELSLSLSNMFDELWDVAGREYLNRFQAYDAIVSMGEIMSSSIFFHYLQSLGIRSKLIDAREIVSTNNNYSDASVDWKKTDDNIRKIVSPLLKDGFVVITQGFIGADINANPTTLGREGSDFTAAIFGNILNADEVTIWKDVPGLMNADPARFENVVKIDSLSYHEAIELAYYGASVIHPKTIQPLKQKNIPLLVRPYYNTSIQPTVINNDKSGDNKTPSIIVKDSQVLLSISTKNLSFIEENNLGLIFSLFSKNKIHINLMQNSAVSFSVSFNYDKNKLNSLLKDLEPDYILRYNTGLQLITIRHYNDEIIKKYIGQRKVYLEQKSRVTVQVLVGE